MYKSLLPIRRLCVGRKANPPVSVNKLTNLNFLAPNNRGQRELIVNAQQTGEKTALNQERIDGGIAEKKTLYHIYASFGHKRSYSTGPKNDKNVPYQSWKSDYNKALEKISGLESELTAAKEHTAHLLSRVAPAFLGKYIDQAEGYLLWSRGSPPLSDAKDDDARLVAPDMNPEVLNNKAQQLLNRVAEGEEFRRRDYTLEYLKEKIFYHYKEWKYILANPNKNAANILELKRLIKEHNIDEETFVVEMAFLWVWTNCSNFVNFKCPLEYYIKTVDPLLASLSLYEISSPSTPKAVEILYKFMRRGNNDK